MNKILSMLFFLTAVFTNAQVGIGTTSPYATLDIRSTNQATPANNDGILVPKVDAFPLINPTALQNGMLVFLTTTSGSNLPGFYYWNNPTTSWIGFTTATTGWSLTGNLLSNPVTEFMGSANDRDIVFKRNGIRAGYIGDPIYDGSFNYNNGNTSFGANSMVNPSINIPSQFGVRNAAFGTNVMPGLTTGQRNVGIGDLSLFLNTSGSENTAVGVGALYSNAIATANVAVGRNALTTSNGSFNTAVGFASLRQNASGTNNTALGYEALRNNLGSGNIGVGYQAGRLETGSNKLYIENSNADASNALIYGDLGSSPKVLRTNSQFQIGDAGTTGYKFPVGRGTNKQVLETDASGTLSWTNGINNFSIVRATLGNSNQLLGATGWQKITFNTKSFDTNTEFDTTLNRFVATKAGYYRINAGYHTDTQNNTNYYAIGVRINNAFYQEAGTKHASADIVSRQINCIVSLAIGDYVEIFVNNPTIGVSIDGYTGKTFFEIQQIR